MKEVPLHMVGKFQSLFRMRHQAAVNPRWRSGDAYVGHIIVHVLEDLFCILTVEMPLAVDGILTGVIVVVVPVSVAAVIVDQHVVN